ncbi:TnsA-like heteromeric transposase endonuclease subunit [Streptomyces pulveraceus]|uniref:TnsA-like heteromeric transposase endonuclease subunit n=1 Tax=Streptomyces pulveraceus TaxID=68258 RepID=UPI003CD06D89
MRPFRWSRGERHFAGWYWAATNGQHVGFESWLERDRLLLMDFDPKVVGIASQPFWLHWHDGERERRHAPALLRAPWRRLGVGRRCPCG